MQALKYRTTHAWGRSKWKYELFIECDLTDEFLQKFADDMAEDFSWSDKFRRVEVDRVDISDVPTEFLQSRLRVSQITLSDYQKRVQDLVKILKERTDTEKIV